MSSHREHAWVPAPRDALWELVGDPRRHPEWWPRIEDVDGDRFETGDVYVQVTRGPTGRNRTRLVVETRDELREVHLRCLDTGTYTRWVLAEARGGTFVEAEFGIEPTGFATRAWDATAGRMFFRRWLDASLDALGRAADTAQARR